MRQPSDRRRVPPAVAQRRLAVFAAVVFALAAGGVAALSAGTPEDDAVAHFLMNRSAWSDPLHLLHPWGRPGHTLPYTLAAWPADIVVAHRLSNVMSVLLAAVTALMAAGIARRLGVRRWGWAAVLYVVMPLVILNGTTVLTETVAAFYVAAGTLLLLTRRHVFAALVFGLLPLTRHESIVLLPVLGVFFAWRGSWLAVPMLLLPEVAWNLAAHQWLWGDRWMFDRYLSPPSSDGLGRGHPLHYLGMWVQAATPAGVALTLAGALPLARKLYRTLKLRRLWLRRSHTGTRSPAMIDRSFAIFLCIAGGLGMVVLQTYLYAFNTHASGGYARFLLPAMPWMAVCSAVAIQPIALLPRRGRLDVRANQSVAWRVRLLVAVLVLVAAGGAIGLFISFDVSKTIERLPAWRLAMAVTMWSAVGIATIFGLFVLWNPGSRRALAGFLTASCVCMAAGGLWHLMPTPLDNRSRLLAEAVAAVRDQGVPTSVIDGSNPWVEYFLDRALSPHGAFPESAWSTDAAVGRVWLHDLRYAQGRLSRQELERYPHEVVFAGEPDVGPDAGDAEPFVVGYRRMAE